jgi:putative cell wall-binding protein
MRKLLLILVALCVAFMMISVTFAADSTTVNGYVSDSKCGAKGANAGAAECTKKCIQGGAKMVVVTDKDQKVLMVENPDTLTGHEGHHVAVTGHVNGDSIHVESVKML